MSSVAILVERAAHLPLALAARTRHGAESQFVALSPAVMTALEAAGEPFVVPEDFVVAAELKPLGMLSYERLEALGSWIGERWPHDLVDPNPVSIHYYRLKLLIDSVGIRARHLNAICAGRERVVAFLSANDPLWSEDHRYEFLTLHGPIYAAVLPHVAASVGVACEVVAAPPLDPPRAPAGARLRRWRTAVRGAAAALAAEVKVRATMPAPVRYGGRRHDMAALEAAATAACGRPVVPVDSRLSSRRARARSEETGADPEERRVRADAAWSLNEAALSAHPVFSTFGTDVFPLVRDSFRHLLTTGVADRARALRGGQRLARRAALALAMHSGRFEDALASVAFRAAGHAVVYGQEGGLYGYVASPMHHYCELSLGSHFIAYGPAVAAHLRQTRRTPRQRAEVVVGGSADLRAAAAAWSRPVPSRIARVLYTTSHDFHHCVTYAPLCFSDRAYYRVKRRVLEALLDIDGIEILYQPPKRAFAHDSCRAFVEAHRDRIVPLDASLRESLGDADLIVLDWPTTVLLEALTTNCPIVVLFSADVMDADPAAMELLARRASISRTLEEFVVAIRRAVGGAPGPDPTDRAFLDMYGTGGAAAWTAAAATRFFEGLCAAR